MPVPSIHLLQNQPIRFGFEEEACANNDNRAYCRLVEDGDVVRSYFKRIRGTTLSTCDLTAVSATQMLTNSGFTGSATGWTLTGGWSYSADTVTITAGSGLVRQAAAGMVDNGMYKVSVVTTITSTGPLTVSLSGVVIGTIPTGSVAGTYNFYGICDIGTSSEVTLTASTTTITVTSVELYRVAECFVFDVSDGTVSYSETEGIAVDGTVDITVDLTLEPSSTYSIQSTLAVSGYQTGTIEFVYDVTSSTALPGSNGDFSYTVNGANYGDLLITLTDFTGNIEDMTFVQLSSAYYVGLFDLDGVFVQNMNDYVSYNREWGYIVFAPALIGLDHGCYKLGFYDPFLHDDQITYEYDFTTLGVAWTESPGADWALSAGNGYRFTANSTNGNYIEEADAVSPSGSAAITTLRVEFQNNSLNAAANFNQQIFSAGPGTYIENNTDAIAESVFADAEFHDPLETYNTTLTKRIVIDSGGASAGTVDVKNAFFKVYPYHIDYYSTCFNYSANHPCTKLIYALPGENLGFGPGTQIHFRVRGVKIIPTYKVSPSSDYIGSDSTRTLISGTGQKVYTLLFDYMDEPAHDVVMTLLLSQQIYITESVAGLADETQYKRYFAIPQDYTPEWDKDGKLNLAMGRIQLIEYDQVKFTTNCGN